MKVKDIWELETYSPCEHRNGELDYERCSHFRGQNGCSFNNCPIIYMDIINEFAKEVLAKGFLLEFMDRGEGTKLTISYGRYELWMQSHHQASKMYFAQTLEALCKFGIPIVIKETETRIPGRFSDPIF